MALARHIKYNMFLLINLWVNLRAKLLQSNLLLTLYQEFFIGINFQSFVISTASRIQGGAGEDGHDIESMYKMALHF